MSIFAKQQTTKMTTEHLSGKNENWSVGKKLLMLFILSYLLLYMFPFPLDNISQISGAIEYYTKPLDAINLWVGKNILKVPILEKIEETGSGDTTFDYVKLLTLPLLSIIISLAVFAFSYRKKNYRQLLSWTTIYARYCLGLYMLVYGFAKVFEGQFAFPDLFRLEQPYGNSSPMGLLWTFMGYSKAYTVFSGTAEIVGGFLLFFRKTTVLGCLITIGVMLNIVAMNFCYDVPVKLFSSHLVLISIFILSPDIQKIFRFFFLQKETTLTTSKLELSKGWMRVGRIIFKCILIVGIPAIILIEEITAMDEFADLPYPQEMNGVYKTEIFAKNDSTLPPLATDATRWSKMIIEYGGANITTMADSSAYYKIEADTIGKKLIYSSYEDTAEKYFLTYENKPDNHLFLSGIYMSDSITILMKKKSAKDYRLVNRGFHWINEYPYNR